MNMIEQIMKDPENVLLTSDTVEHAIDVVLSRCISTCPVTTPSGEFLGQITDATLIKAVVLKSSGKKIKTINDLKGMYIKSQTISKTGTLSHLITKVFKSRSQRVFVVDKKKKLLGLVSPKD
ncbi:MAG: CBS domain-containing protein, partial [Bdellovibrionales bacterium]|nr:CBS domain-containing protein [Bdellovibrionales bacterium]